MARVSSIATTASATGPRFASTFPIGREPDGRIVLVYLVTEVWPRRFRRFLQTMRRCCDSLRLDLAARVSTTARPRLRCLSEPSSVTSWSRRFTGIVRDQKYFEPPSGGMFAHSASLQAGPRF